MHDYDMSDSRLGRGMATVLVLWALAAALAFATVGCHSRKPAGPHYAFPRVVDPVSEKEVPHAP